VAFGAAQSDRYFEAERFLRLAGDFAAAAPAVVIVVARADFVLSAVAAVALAGRLNRAFRAACFGVAFAVLPD
jgi:hypothetical protein